MRLAVLADGEVGLALIDFLFNNYPEDLVLIFTIEENRITKLSREFGIASTIYESETQLVKVLLLNKIELGILAWWPHIVGPNVISSVQRGFINTHPSLLPFNRGRHYNFWAIVEQNPFGVSLHTVDQGVDTGEIVGQQTIEYDWTDTGGSLYFKAQKAIIKLLRKEYPRLRSGKVQTWEQDLKLGSYHAENELEEASRIDLDGTYSGRELLNLLRARTFPGKPACWFREGSVRFEVTVNIERS